MAKPIKSFDDLYREVIGKEPPEMKDTVSDAKKIEPFKVSHKKIEVILSDPSNRKDVWGSGQKRKAKRNAPGKKSNNHNIKNKQNGQNQKNRERGLNASLKKREAERRAFKETSTFRKDMRPLGAAIRCPIHGTMLLTGKRIRVEGVNNTVDLYFCGECNLFYYRMKKAEEKLSGKLRGFEIRNIISPTFSTNYASTVNDTKTVRDRFSECVRANGIKLYQIGEPNVSRCPECNKDISEAQEKDILTVHFFDDSTRGIFGSFCNSCGAVVISIDRLRSLEKYCNADSIESITTKNRAVITEADVLKAQKQFDPNTTILYVHQGKVGCLTNHHNVINVALRIPSCIKTSFVVINANYCFDCDRFFISLDEYEYYRSIYPIMLIKFEYVSADENAIGRNLAEKSPLMMAGYTVRATSNYSDVQRQNILRNVIKLGILRKHEVISYLNYFISMNGKARGMENAVAKWGKDLEFVRTHNFEEQKRGNAENIKKW